jgi:hypothetical protein
VWSRGEGARGWLEERRREAEGARGGFDEQRRKTEEVARRRDARGWLEE